MGGAGGRRQAAGSGFPAAAAGPGPWRPQSGVRNGFKASPCLGGPRGGISREPEGGIEALTARGCGIFCHSRIAKSLFLFGIFGFAEGSRQAPETGDLLDQLQKHQIARVVAQGIKVGIVPEPFVEFDR